MTKPPDDGNGGCGRDLLTLAGNPTAPPAALVLRLHKSNLLVQANHTGPQENTEQSLAKSLTTAALTLPLGLSSSNQRVRGRGKKGRGQCWGGGALFTREAIPQGPTKAQWPANLMEELVAASVLLTVAQGARKTGLCEEDEASCSWSQ